MDDEQRAFYDKVVAGPRGQRFREQLVAADGSLRGPFEFLICDPVLGDPIQQIGAELRFRPGLRDDVRELAILVVAATLPSQFEWDAHLPLAVDAGLPATLLERMRVAGADAASVSFGDPLLDLVVRAGREMCRTATLGEPTLRELEAALGRRAAFGILALFGYYTLLGMLLNAYETPSVPPLSE
jgi:4-carboxymuconolactone decarboxylase